MADVEVTGLDVFKRDMDALPEAFRVYAIDPMVDKIDQNRRANTARRSGRLQDLRDARSVFEGADAYTRILEMKSGYSDVYERGMRKHPAYFGRFPIQRAIEGTDPRPFFDEAMDEGLRGAR